MVSVVRFYWPHGPLNCDHQCKYVLCTDINIVNSGQMKLATFAPNVTCRAGNEPLRSFTITDFNLIVSYM